MYACCDNFVKGYILKMVQDKPKVPINHGYKVIHEHGHDSLSPCVAFQCQVEIKKTQFQIDRVYLESIHI